MISEGAEHEDDYEQSDIASLQTDNNEGVDDAPLKATDSLTMVDNQPAKSTLYHQRLSSKADNDEELAWRESIDASQSAQATLLLSRSSSVLWQKKTVIIGGLPGKSFKSSRARAIINKVFPFAVLYQSAKKRRGHVLGESCMTTNLLSGSH